MTKKPEQEEKSRSQAKREHHELKDLGKQLAALSKSQLNAIPLAESTREALLATKPLTRNALQRQYRYLASLLTEEDVPSIRAALAGELQPHADEVAAQQEVERWRDRFLFEDEAPVTAFVEQFPQCDRTHLRQLVRSAKKERELGKPPKSARLLFRYIKQLFEG